MTAENLFPLLALLAPAAFALVGFLTLGVMQWREDTRCEREWQAHLEWCDLVTSGFRLAADKKAQRARLDKTLEDALSDELSRPPTLRFYGRRCPTANAPRAGIIVLDDIQTELTPAQYDAIWARVTDLKARDALTRTKPLAESDAQLPLRPPAPDGGGADR